MAESCYYRVATAIRMINPSLSSRTFYDWLNRIEQVTDYRFCAKNVFLQEKLLIKYC